MDSQRPGPEPLPHDSWDSATTGLHGATRPYRRHRRYVWVALILAVAALVPTVGVRLLLPDYRSARDPAPTAGEEPVRVRTSAPAATGSPAVAVAVGAPTGTDAGTRGGAPGLPTPPGDRPGTAATVTLPLAIEAEAPVVGLRRAAVEQVDGASGGQVVRYTAANGDVRVGALAVPTGTYRVTVTYAPGGTWSGYLRGSDGPVAVSFEAGTGCCATVSSLVLLTPGASLHIGLSRGDGAYPAVDRIVIERA